MSLPEPGYDSEATPLIAYIALPSSIEELALDDAFGVESRPSPDGAKSFEVLPPDEATSRSILL